MKKTSTAYITVGAVIAAAYAGLTYLSGLMGLAYGPIQFRISEAMCILPAFTPAAVPGLTLGCIIANIGSFNPIDMVVGSAATLIAAILTRLLAKYKTGGLPLLSLLPPIFVNAVLVGFELALFGLGTANIWNKGFWVAFLITFLEIAASQTLVCVVLAIPLAYVLEKKKIF